MNFKTSGKYKALKKKYFNNITCHTTVADPGFDLMVGGRGPFQEGGGGRQALKVLKVEVKVIFCVFSLDPLVHMTSRNFQLLV